MISQTHSNRRAYNWLVYRSSDRFLESFAPFYTGSLYDLGAGESPYRDFFLRHCSRYVAVDWPGSVYRGKIDVSADLNHPLPIESDAADTVVSLSVMEHLCEPQVMLGEAFRILRPGGGIVLQVPWQWSIHEAPHDYFRYTPYGLRHLFGKSGFVDVQVAPQCGFFSMWFLKWNYFSLRFIRGPRPVRWLVRALLAPVWYLDQKAAPWLDRLDRNWDAETTGYFVTARKPA